MLTINEPGWRTALSSELDALHTQRLVAFLESEEAAKKEIFPPRDKLFRALELTPLDSVRVVIIGQDPYHKPGQAHGLSFSVQPGVGLPPSLRNIYAELKTDLGIEPAKHGFLEHWARQGVLLINSLLTVERGRPASHKEKGWERITDAIVRAVNSKSSPVVFLLWGGPAQEKGASVDSIENNGRHLVLTSSHPSFFSAHKGFFGCRHFSKTNAFLKRQGMTPIDWELPPID